MCTRGKIARQELNVRFLIIVLVKEIAFSRGRRSICIHLRDGTERTLASSRNITDLDSGSHTGIQNVINCRVDFRARNRRRSLATWNFQLQSTTSHLNICGLIQLGIRGAASTDGVRTLGETSGECVRGEVERL